MGALVGHSSLSPALCFTEKMPRTPNLCTFGGDPSPLDRNPSKQSLGQILDKFGLRWAKSPIASDFGSRTQIAALFAILLHPNV